MKKKNYILLIFLSIALGLHAQDFEISPVSLVFDAEPGQTQSKTITITNHANRKSAFTVVLQDFVLNKEGKKISVKTVDTEHSLVNWLSINPPFLEMNPNETRQIIVSIQAPVGDYSTRWANILIRNTQEQTALTADKSVQTGMNILGQIAIEVYQSPKSNINYKMKLTGLTEITTLNDTLRRFKAIVDNIGDKISHCKVTLLASNIANAKEKSLQVIKFTSFPDTQREIYLSFNKKELPSGKYALAAILDYGKQSNLEGSQIIINVR